MFRAHSELIPINHHNTNQEITMTQLFSVQSLINLAVITLIVGVALSACSKNFGDPAELQSLVKAGAKLIDVRTPQEYGAGHIEGAINIPVSQVEARLAEFGDKGAPIVVYCRSGARSGRAQSMLKTAGFTKVYNLGGMTRWPKP